MCGRPMRIMLVNQYAGSPTLGMEFRPHWMALEWQNLGHDVLVITGDCSHLRTSQPPRGRHSIADVEFLTLRTLPYRVNGPIRFANIVSFKAQLAARKLELARWGPDVVVASSTHPMDIRAAVDVARIAGSKFVYEVHDLWPLTPRLLGGMSESHPMIRWMQREEDYGYRNADLVVSLLPFTEGYSIAHGLEPGRWVFRMASS
jgi:glycosyltransferase involved in cell wall biosynthesis